jgi:hypothetical protein
VTVKEKQKKQIKELHDKYYKGKKKEPQALLPHSHLTKKLKEATFGNTGHVAGSRADLMDQARAQGVKNFRVLNKAELDEVTKESTDEKRKQEIVAGAVARWRSGWGTKSREA